jgi:hypothetical protein
VVAGSNGALTALLAEAGISAESLARQVNVLSAAAGTPRTYTHTSVANWTRRGVLPDRATRQHIVQVLIGHLGRPVTLSEAGLSASDAEGGEWPTLDYPHNLTTAIHAATDVWSAMRRRELLTTTAFAAAFYTTPLARWLIHPADPDSAHRGPIHVTDGHIAALREHAEHARAADSRWGGGDPAPSRP